MRCTHEMTLHEDNSFITLTYNDENLPANGTLIKRHLQLFMKRLRKHYAQKKIRFYACGEYGEELLRPHYHAILFGLTFPDGELYSVRDDKKTYTSAILEKIWGQGFATFTEASFETAAYTARYVMKKINGDKQEKHYQGCDPETGEIFDLLPEFGTMSTKPGIASGWFDKYKNDLKKDFITIRGIKMKPAKYYDRLFEKSDPYLLDELKEKRQLSIDPNDPENTRKRLDVKHIIRQRKIKQNLKRKL